MQRGNENRHKTMLPATIMAVALFMGSVSVYSYAAGRICVGMAVCGIISGIFAFYTALLMLVYKNRNDINRKKMKKTNRTLGIMLMLVGIAAFCSMIWWGTTGYEPGFAIGIFFCGAGFFFSVLGT